MDFMIRVIGVIALVTGGTTPDISVNTALAPLAVAASYCSGNRTVTVEPHSAYVRVSDAQIVDDSGWTGSVPCDASENCTLFEIPAGSELTIDPGFTPTGGTNTHGPSFCQIAPLSDVKPGVKLIATPRTKAHFAFEFPPGKLEGVALANGSVGTYQWVRAPLGSSVTPIQVHATPFGGGGTRTLKVKAGTLINLVYLPPHHAKGDLNAMSATQPPERRHFYLINELLSAANQICTQPPPVPRPLIVAPDGSVRCGAPDNDPFCSNTGCC